MVDRRLYAQFTLNYADSHKIAPLSDAAFRAHVSMVLWARKELTDGKIPARMAFVLANRKRKVLSELTTNDPISPSLVMDEHGDYWLHDFLEHQSSKAQVEAKQETNRANGAKGGQAKAKRIATESLSEPVADSYTETETETKTPLPSEGGRADATAPSPFCPKHPTGSDRPCRPCGDARRARDTWTPPATPVRSVRHIPGLCDDHRQPEGTCEICEYENRRAAEVIQGRFGAA